MANCNLETEYNEIINGNGFAMVYQKISNQCLLYDFTCIEARKPENKLLNRYRDVNPYDHTRVILKRGPQDYINANLVKMERANRKYILTQGPLPDTVGHFWLMVWEQDTRAILMLNKIIEKSEVKCHIYWPTGTGPEDKLHLDDVQLDVELLSAETYTYYCTRKLRLTDLESGEQREVIQFHYTTWPDFGVPTSPFAFLEFLKRVRDSGGLESNVGPAIVHCSAGIGRSGTFCLVDSCLVLIEKEGSNSVNVQEVLLELRRDRMGLIQTPEQLRFSYQAIIAGYKLLGNEEELHQQLLKEMQCALNQDCDNEDSPPPPPPPRSGSLPHRPLPPIPHSRSLEEMYHSDDDELSESDDTESLSASDEGSAAPPSPDSPQKDDVYKKESSQDDNSHDEDDQSKSESAMIRRRNLSTMAMRLSSMRRKQQSSEHWNSVKRSLFRPAAVTFGFILCGVVAYVYVNK